MPSRRTKAGAEDGEEIGLRPIRDVVVDVLQNAWCAPRVTASRQKEKPTPALKAGLVFLKRMKGE